MTNSILLYFTQVLIELFINCQLVDYLNYPVQDKYLSGVSQEKFDKHIFYKYALFLTDSKTDK